MRYCAAIPAMILIIVLPAVCISWAAERGTAERRAGPGDLAMHVELIPKDGVITAGEPLIARVTFTNQAQETVRFLMPGVRGCTYMEIADGRGEIVSATPEPQPERYADMLFSGPTLAPGESYERLLIVSAWYQFEQTGEYTIRIQQLEFKKELPVLCEGSASVNVLPFDAARLEARCEELFQPIRKHQSGGLALGVRARALYSVRHDVVLPYLDWMAREWDDEYSCLALRRMGSERAQALMAALVARQDRVGEAARYALKMPLEPTLYEVSR